MCQCFDHADIRKYDVKYSSTAKLCQIVSSSIPYSPPPSPSFTQTTNPDPTPLSYPYLLLIYSSPPPTFI